MMIVVIEIDQRRSIRQFEFQTSIITTAGDLQIQRWNTDRFVAAFSLDTEDQRGRVFVRLAGVD